MKKNQLNMDFVKKLNSNSELLSQNFFKSAKKFRKKRYDIWYLHTKELLKIYMRKFVYEIFTHKSELKLYFFQKYFFSEKYSIKSLRIAYYTTHLSFFLS